ncbi:hypothetical protein ACQ4M4_00350 [Leptolyngbya sp. AN02str]|uniref:hypothetical protein n=1 Tax=Leptolyngbya sp. AN02str TaxID=3423363 RepID=UPI003D311B21
MNNSAANGKPPAPSSTVPITVYRELAAELQATKAMLDSVHAQNQQLVRQNQQLRQELERIGQSVGSIQQIAASLQPNWGTPTDADRMDAAAIAAQIRPGRSDSRTPQPDSPNGHSNTPTPPTLFSEQGALPHQPSSVSTPRDLSGLWLGLTVFVIIVTAFGAGFMVVKPLIPSSR